jgi:hypothetical protein
VLTRIQAQHGSKVETPQASTSNTVESRFSLSGAPNRSCLTSKCSSALTTPRLISATGEIGRWSPCPRCGFRDNVVTFVWKQRLSWLGHVQRSAHTVIWCLALAMWLSRRTSGTSTMTPTSAICCSNPRRSYSRRMRCGLGARVRTTRLLNSSRGLDPRRRTQLIVAGLDRLVHSRALGVAEFVSGGGSHFCPLVRKIV